MGGWLVTTDGLRGINTGALWAWGTTPPPDPEPDPEPMPDPAWGTPGARPSIAKPDATNSGARRLPTATFTGDEALAAVLAAPIEADGRRYLRRANITSAVRLRDPSHHSIVFEDCQITHSGTYVVRSFYNDGGAAPAGAWPEFRFCTIRGGNSSTFIGGFCRFMRCDMSLGTDIYKPMDPFEIYGCYAHDTWHGDGAHCDIVQIVSYATGHISWCNFQGFNAADSPTAGGSWSSGVLQTGTMTADTGPVVWADNWFNGAGYTIRGAETAYVTDMTFRRNKFGRGYRFGPVYRVAAFDFDPSNVWEDTGLPVE